MQKLGQYLTYQDFQLIKQQQNEQDVKDAFEKG